jgi:Ca2+-transporting ATPase
LNLGHNLLSQRLAKGVPIQETERGVKVIRGGNEEFVGVKDVSCRGRRAIGVWRDHLVRWCLLLGRNVKCDESGATGESEAIKKVRECAH